MNEKRVLLVVLVRKSETVCDNATGEIRTKPATRAYSDGYDAIDWGNKRTKSEAVLN